MATELNTAVTTPTGLLGHDGSGPGTVTPTRARTLLNVEDGATADQTAQEIATAIDGDATAESTLQAALVTEAAIIAGGGLADSEVTNLAAVKAFDPADYLVPADIGDTVASQADVDAKRPIAQVVNSNITTSTTLTNAHIGRLIPVTGSGITLDFNVTSVNAGESWDIVNIGTNDVTISNGTSGINRAGFDSFALSVDQAVRITYRQASDPQLVADEITESLTLAANQYAANDSAGTAQEARTDKVCISCAVAAPASETLAATGSVTFFGPDFPVTLNNVRLVTVGDTASVQIYEAGGAINGFGSPVGATTTAGNTASTEAIAANATLRLDWSSGGASLTAIAAVLYATRTGN